MPLSETLETIGLIAGNGTFPLVFAREARRRGFRVVAIAHRGETEEALESEVDSLVWVRVGQLGKMLRGMRRQGVSRAVMAGGIDKARSLGSLRPDLRGVLFLRRVRAKGDDAILRQLAREFERNGIEIVPSTFFLEELMTTPGQIAGPRIDDRVLRDIRLGCAVLGALGPHDVGQGVVVEQGVVLAVEAIEGTDALIRRAGELGNGGAVVVKTAKKGQDMRFDVPAVGPETIASMVAAGVGVLACEEGATIILEREEFLERAAGAGISVVGCTADGEVAHAPQ